MIRVRPAGLTVETIILRLGNTRIILDGETETATFLRRGEAGTISLACLGRLVRDLPPRRRP